MTSEERLTAGWRVVAIYYRIKYHASSSRVRFATPNELKRWLKEGHEGHVSSYKVTVWSRKAKPAVKDPLTPSQRIARRLGLED